MKKNNILFFIGLIMVISCQGLNKQKIEKITIEVVDFSLMTTISVDCDKYEEYFNNQYKLIVCSDSITINKLMGTINKLEPIDSTYSKNIDTRAIIKLYSHSDTILICAGNLTLKKDGHIYKTPEALIDLIGDL